MENDSVKFKNDPKKRLILKGKTAVFVDWANVHGWEKSLKREVDAEKLFHYLKSYSEITDIRLYPVRNNTPPLCGAGYRFGQFPRGFKYPARISNGIYFGEDEHPKSKEFLGKSRQTGYTVITKPVKNILIAEIEGQKVYRRKCDFDMEVCIDVHAALRQNLEGFAFFTGDGDYEPLYKMLIGLGRQVIVVYTTGHLGREIWAMKRGIFKVELKNLGEFWL